jgi:predicted DNA-binding protein (UPF0251 family)
MPRPTKWRRVGFLPRFTYFKPAGVPLRMLEEIVLSIEEAEAIRLKDLESLEQEDCAERMQVSRPTFHRVLGSARKKVADALLNGRAIRIEGGNFEMAMRRFQCGRAGHEWDVPFEELLAGPPSTCPSCSSPDIQPAPMPGPPMRGWGRGGRCHGRGRGGRWQG